MGRRRDLNSDLDDGARQQLANRTMEYLNDDRIHGHMKIDHVHNFFIDHRGYVQELEEFLRDSGHSQFVPLPKWEPHDHFKKPFWRCKGMDGGSDFDVASGPIWDLGLRLATPTSLTTPWTFGSVDGLARELGRTFELDPTSYHANSHRNVGPPMYNMMTAASATVFWPLHAFFEQMYTEWELRHIADAKSPAVVTSPLGDHHLFVAGASGTVWHSVQRLGNPGRWSHWLEIAGATAVEVLRAGTCPNGRTELFAIANGKLLHTRQHQNEVDAIAGAVPASVLSQNPQELIGWEGWSTRETTFVPTRLCVADDSDGRLHLFAIDQAGSLWHSWQTSANGLDWTDWEVFGGTKSFKHVVAAKNHDGRLQVFAADTHLRVWHASERKRWSLRGILRSIVSRVFKLISRLFGAQEQPEPEPDVAGGWTPWSKIGESSINGLAVCKTSDGRLMLLGHQNFVLQSAWQESPNSQRWVGWESLTWPGSALSVATMPDGNIAAFTRINASISFAIYRTSGGWSDWQDLGAQSINPAQLVAIANGNGQLECVAVGADGLVYDSYQRAPEADQMKWSIWNIV